MKTYIITAYSRSGEVLLNETIRAETDSIAKTQGLQLLNEKQLINYTHRLVSSNGSLLLFHS